MEWCARDGVALDDVRGASMRCRLWSARCDDAPDRSACSRAVARRVCCECRAVPARRARGRSEVRGCNRVPLHAPHAAGDQRGNRPRARPVCVSARSGVSASSATRGHIQPTDSTMGSAPSALHDLRPARDGAIRPVADAATSHPGSIRATRHPPDPHLQPPEANFVPALALTPTSSPRQGRAFERARPAAACCR